MLSDILKLKCLINKSIFFAFTGSVFLTSGKFVDPQAAPKFYFTALCLCSAALFILINRKPVGEQLAGMNRQYIILGLYLTGTLQAVYGLLQYGGLLPSNHSIFTVTGSFENPAGFTAVLCLLFPAGLYLTFRSAGINKILLWCTLGIYISAVVLSDSRTGLLAMVASLCVFLFYRYKATNSLKLFYPAIALLIIALPVLIISLARLNMQKTEYTNGRLLIWRVSLDMIRERPVTGHGLGAFKARYMDYQADYFLNNPGSRYSLLADNTKHPFNEFIKLIIEFGILGFLVFLFLIMMLTRQSFRKQGPYSVLFLGILASFLVFASFSYPLFYPPVWVLLLIFTGLLLPGKIPFSLNKTFLFVLRFVLVVITIGGIGYFSVKAYAETVWKHIATESLKGKTEVMLPRYAKLYPVLKGNPFFLYNYAAELNEAGRHSQSLILLKECRRKLVDYDVVMLEAENYRKTGDYQMAISGYECASAMIPSKFLPLYHLLEITKEYGLTELAEKYAYEICRKEVKIPSMTVNYIKSIAREYLKVIF